MVVLTAIIVLWDKKTDVITWQDYLRGLKGLLWEVIMDKYEELLAKQIKLINDKLIQKYNIADEEIIDLCKDMCYAMHDRGYQTGYHQGSTDAINSI